jgi:protein-tyrosine phosphatase
MELVQIDDDGRLFISPAINDWTQVEPFQIDTVIDLEGGLDNCIPTIPGRCMYIYFPICDDDLPNLVKLRSIATLGASLVLAGHRVLAHCGMGFNRSALVAGSILIELGMPGPTAVARLRERRPGALFNDRFAGYLQAMSPSNALV